MNTSHAETPEANTMTQTRDPFGLASLPELQPSRDSWSAVSDQLQAGQRRRQRWLSGLAIAATVTLVAGIASILPQLGKAPEQAEEMLATESVGGSHAADPAASHEQGLPLQADNLQSLQKLSQRLEQNLVVLRSGVGAMPAEMVVYQVELEDLVAQVDAAISQNPDSSELWQQRVSLLLDLNQIYGAGLRREEPYVASL